MVVINRCIQFHSERDEARLTGRRVAIRKHNDIADRWLRFLRRKPGESAVQRFLERHPALLPGLTDAHNGPLHDVVITKLPFGPDYKTDFAFVTRHSMALQFTFVELETPSKRIFNKNGTLSQNFRQAQQQVADWVRWSTEHMNALVDMLAPMFATYNVAEDVKDVRAYLVYGRRDEIEGNRRRKERWQSIGLSTDKRIIVMTYDRLRPSFEEENRDLIVCTYENRGLYAKSSAL